jgi:hypothetical protein
MKILLRSALVAVFAVAAPFTASAQAPNLQLSMQDGRVTLIAQDVPLRAILQEWARVGQTKIINADKLSGPPLTLQFVNKSEREVLDILLRSAAGYMAAARPDGTTGVSAYDRITILAASRAPAVTASAAPPAPQPFQRPPQPVIEDDDEPVNVNMPPQMPQQMPQQPPVIAPFPGAAPNAPFATPTPQIEGSQPRIQPGMMPLQQPGQPAQQPMTAPRPGILPATPGQNGVPNPYQQPTVVRPVGGGPGGESGEDR